MYSEIDQDADDLAVLLPPQRPLKTAKQRTRHRIHGNRLQPGLLQQSNMSHQLGAIHSEKDDFLFDFLSLIDTAGRQIADFIAVQVQPEPLRRVFLQGLLQLIGLENIQPQTLDFQRIARQTRHHLASVKPTPA